MDRREFLSAAATAGAGVALAGVDGMASQVAPVRADVAKGGGRALAAEAVSSKDLGGSLSFALARFAEDSDASSLLKRAQLGPDAVLSPLRDVAFHGFAAGVGAGSLSGDQLYVVAVHRTVDGTMARHDLWSHLPIRQGGSSSPTMFTAHDEGFAGFEVTHVSAAGKRSSAFFNFMASGSGPQLKPGIYVLAGPRAASGLAPELGRYAYSGDVRAPVRESRVLGLDFSYVSFAVHGEWV